MKKRTTASSRNTKPDVSIVIPAFNEEQHIKACLNSILKQKTSYSFEIIVCDNNSTDKTAAIVQSYKKTTHPVRLIKEKKKGAAAARAAGFEAAKAPIIFSTDGDTIVPENWIESFMPHFSKRTVIAVTSPCQIDHPSDWNRTVFYYLQLSSMYLHRLLRGYIWISGYSYAVRKDVYNKAGKINTNIGAMDDFELSSRIHNYGKIIFLNQVQVLSSHRRYRDDVIFGLFSYPRAFIKMKVLGRDSVSLKDIR